MGAEGLIFLAVDNRLALALGLSEEWVQSYHSLVSPTVFREGGFRFFFFSREEPRMHVHVSGQEGEAKFWLEPTVELARNYGLSASDLAKAEKLVKEHEHGIRSAWSEHFGG